MPSAVTDNDDNTEERKQQNDTNESRYLEQLEQQASELGGEVDQLKEQMQKKDSALVQLKERIESLRNTKSDGEKAGNKQQHRGEKHMDNTNKQKTPPALTVTAVAETANTIAHSDIETQSKNRKQRALPTRKKRDHGNAQPASSMQHVDQVLARIKAAAAAAAKDNVTKTQLEEETPDGPSPPKKKQKRGPRKTDPKNKPILLPHPTRKYVYKCTTEGCNHEASQGGKCYQHGAKDYYKKKRYPRPACKAEGCTRSVVNDGVCKIHGARKVDKSNWKKPKKKMCKVEDCGKQVSIWGVCYKHGAKYHGKECTHRKCKNLAANIDGVCLEHCPQKMERERKAKQEQMEREQETKKQKMERERKTRMKRQLSELELASANRATSEKGRELAARIMAEAAASKPKPAPVNKYKLCYYGGCENYAIFERDGGMCPVHRERLLMDLAAAKKDGNVATKYATVLSNKDKKDAKKQEKVCSVSGCTNMSKTCSEICTVHTADPDAKICIRGGCSQAAFKGKVFCGLHAVCSINGCNKFSKRYSKRCTAHTGIPDAQICMRAGCSDAAFEGKVFCGLHGGNANDDNYCNVEGCTFRAEEKGGYCSKHEEPKACTFEGCTTLTKRDGGLCWKHSLRRSKRGCREVQEEIGSANQSSALKEMSKTLASVVATATKQTLAHPTNDAICTPVVPPPPCSVAGCTEISKMGGLCSRHWI